MHVAIIGAGSAGLCAARHALATVSADGSPFSCVVFERAAELGGTWVYTDRTGLDEFGLPIHTSMYRSLRTNLPKEVMGFPDFPIPVQEKSYIPANDMLAFLNLYAENFKIKPHTKFNHQVNSVKPVDEEKWQLTITDLVNNVEYDEVFDAVMVCNGHYHSPIYPEIPDQDLFEGRALHSHEYRVPEPFANKKILVMGAGPSGIDMALELAKVGKKVVLSHHLKEPLTFQFSSNFSQKGDVERMTKTGVVFKDGEVEDFDVVFYCTGYRYKFPFLSQECGITVEGNFYVKHLYKHLVNISRPTMCFVGLPFYVCTSQMFDLQVRYFVKFLSGEMKLPCKDDMMADTNRDMQERWCRGYPLKQAHMMGTDQVKYYRSLATAANTKPIDEVMIKLHDEGIKRFFADPIHFREGVFRVVNEESFVQIM